MQQVLAAGPPAVGGLSWWPVATDVPKLRSLLRNPAKYPGSTLDESVDKSFAVQHELLKQGGSRVTIFGNTSVQPSYQQAWSHVLAIHPSKELAIRCSAIPASAAATADAVMHPAGYHQSYYNPCYQYVCQTDAASLEKQLSAALQLMPAEHYELSQLQQNDAELINATWTYRGPGTLELVRQLICSSSHACIRQLSDGAPVCWALEVEPGCAGMLHTLAQHRRKGLARLVLLSLLHKLQFQAEQAESSIPPPLPEQLLSQQDVNVQVHSDNHMTTGIVYCYVVQDNNASIACLQGIGLKSTGVFIWMGYEKRPQPVEPKS